MGGASSLLLSDTTMRLPPVSGLSKSSLALRQVYYWIWVQELSKTHHPNPTPTPKHWSLFIGGVGCEMGLSAYRPAWVGLEWRG